eukprot:4142319-Amphidinium_carterae.1
MDGPMLHQLPLQTILHEPTVALRKPAPCFPVESIALVTHRSLIRCAMMLHLAMSSPYMRVQQLRAV